jgi:hypothetical protein
MKIMAKTTMGQHLKCEDLQELRFLIPERISSHLLPDMVWATVTCSQPKLTLSPCFWVLSLLFLFVQIQENETTVNEQPSVSTITAELTRPTLDTLLDGMRRIRDQLSSVAGRK